MTRDEKSSVGHVFLAFGIISTSIAVGVDEGWTHGLLVFGALVGALGVFIWAAL